MRKIGVTVKERKSRGPKNWGMSAKMDPLVVLATLYKVLGLRLWVDRTKITVEQASTPLSPNNSNLMNFRARQVFTNHHNSNINKVLPTATDSTLAFLKSTSATRLLSSSVRTLTISSKLPSLPPSTNGIPLFNNSRPTQLLASTTCLLIWQTLASLMRGDRLVILRIMASKFMDQPPPRLKIITTPNKMVRPNNDSHTLRRSNNTIIKVAQLEAISNNVNSKWEWD